MNKIINWLIIIFITLGSSLGMYSYLRISELKASLTRLEIDMIEQDLKPLNVICTWDIPAEHIGADLPPLPVRKHKN